MLENIAANAKLGFKMLRENNLNAFAELLSESWRKVNEVESGSVETVTILRKLCGKDLPGLKIGGAGGGGFILAIFHDEEKKEYYKRIIKESFPDCLLYNPVFGGTGLSFYQNDSLEFHERHMQHIEKVTYV